MKHGLSNKRGYPSWHSMLRRCLDPQHKDYIFYGARGITVDKCWHDFRNFYADMGEAPVGMSLDRINNQLGYFKENCRWATASQQMLNGTRKSLYFGSDFFEACCARKSWEAQVVPT